MKWSDITKWLANWFAKFFMAVFVITLLFGAILYCTDKTSKTTTPVEKEEIDSIVKENDKLIIEVEHLDSVKDAKIIEVKSLDNDSTLRLFYKLVSE